MIPGPPVGCGVKGPYSRLKEKSAHLQVTTGPSLAAEPRAVARCDSNRSASYRRNPILDGSMQRMFRMCKIFERRKRRAFRNDAACDALTGVYVVRETLVG